MKQILKPDMCFLSVEEIDFTKLKEKNVEFIMLDLDNTLIDFYKNLKESTIEWVNKAKENGFKVFILSNTNKYKKVSMAAEALNIPFINNARKPLKKGFKKAIKEFNIIPEKTAMVGDQVLTDVVGANKMNMVSVYVNPISKKEHFYTSWKRPLEAWILKKVGATYNS